MTISNILLSQSPQISPYKRTIQSLANSPGNKRIQEKVINKQNPTKNSQQVVLESYRKSIDYNMPEDLLQQRQKQLKLQSLVYNSKVNMETIKEQDQQEKYQIKEQSRRESEIIDPSIFNETSPMNSQDKVAANTAALLDLMQMTNFKNPRLKSLPKTTKILSQKQSPRFSDLNTTHIIPSQATGRSSIMSIQAENNIGRMSPLAQMKKQLYNNIDDLKLMYKENFLKKTKEERFKLYQQQLQLTQKFNQPERKTSQLFTPKINSVGQKSGNTNSNSGINPFSGFQMGSNQNIIVAPKSPKGFRERMKMSQELDLMEGMGSNQFSGTGKVRFDPINKSDSKEDMKPQLPIQGLKPTSLTTAQLYEQRFYPLDFNKELQEKQKISKNDQKKRDEISKIKHIEIIQERLTDDQEEVMQRALERDFDKRTSLKAQTSKNSNGNFHNSLNQKKNGFNMGDKDMMDSELREMNLLEESYKFLRDKDQEFMKSLKFSDSKNQGMINKFVREKKQFANTSNLSFIPSSSQRSSPRQSEMSSNISNLSKLRGRANQSHVSERSGGGFMHFNVNTSNRSYVFNQLYTPLSSSRYNIDTPSKISSGFGNASNLPSTSQNLNPLKAPTKPVLFNFAKFAKENQEYFTKELKQELDSQREMKDKITKFKREASQKMKSLNISMPSMWKQQEERSQMLDRIRLQSQKNRQNLQSYQHQQQSSVMIENSLMESGSGIPRSQQASPRQL